MIIFDDMVAGMLSNEKLNPVVTELFIKGRKLNIFLFFFNKILFCCTKKYYAKFYRLFYCESS